MPGARRLLSLLAAFVLLCAAATPARAEDRASRVDPYAGLAQSARAMAAGAVEKFTDGNCGAGWGLTWRLFRGGQSLAAAGLAYAVYYKGLVPPGSTPDRVSQARHLFILTAYAAPSENPQALALLRTVHRAFGLGRFGPGAGAFLACLEDPDRSGQSCLDDAIGAGLLPRIEDYAREVDGFTRTGARRAFCDVGSALWPGARTAANPHAASLGD